MKTATKHFGLAIGP